MSLENIEISYEEGIGIRGKPIEPVYDFYRITNRVRDIGVLVTGFSLVRQLLMKPSPKETLVELCMVGGLLGVVSGYHYFKVEEAQK